MGGTKRSPATEARYLRADIARLKRHLYDANVTIVELREKIRIGRQISNLCYNAAQRNDVPAPVRECMDELRKEWDRK